MTRRMCVQTNLYQAQFESTRGMVRKGNGVEWKKLNVAEFNVMMGILIALGLNNCIAPRKLWGNNPVFHNEFVSERMPRDRFLAILRFLHISDNADVSAATSDCLYKVRWLMDQVNKQCKANWNLGRTISVDEIDIGLFHFYFICFLLMIIT